MQDFFSQLIHIAQIQWVQQAFWTVVLALATLATSRIVARAMRHILDRDSNPLPSSSIIINIVRATILTLGASIILDVIYNINANAIITTLGVGGIAISLGFQDTLSNLIGGLQVTFMGIVRPGDNIEVGSESGVVQDVSWRHTTIKDALGQTVIVPNSIISKTAVEDYENFGLLLSFDLSGISMDRYLYIVSHKNNPLPFIGEVFLNFVKMYYDK